MNQGEAVELLPTGKIFEKNMDISWKDPGKSSSIEHTVTSTVAGKHFSEI